MSRKPGYPPAPQKPALFARRSAAKKPPGVSRGFFVVQEIYSRPRGFVPIRKDARKNILSTRAAVVLLLLAACGCASLRAQTQSAIPATVPVYKEYVDE